MHSVDALDQNEWAMLFGFLMPVEAVEDGVSLAPVRRIDVVEVRYLDPGGKLDIYQPPWIAVVRVRDGRWAFLSLAGSFTADPPACWTHVWVAHDLRRLWWGALGDTERERFTSQMTQEDREAELVELDALLEAGDPMAERRVAQLRASTAR
jgi:hypothetical protein